MTAPLPKHTSVFDADIVLSALPHPVFLLDAGLHCVWRNAAAQSLQLNALIAPDSSLHAAAQDCLKSGRDVTLHDHDLSGHACVMITLQPLDGRLLLTAVMAGQMHDPRGQDAEAALRPAALMARVLAHEIKNPLAGIQAAGQLLGKTAAPENRELTDLIVREAGRIRRLVDQVMIFDADAPVQMQPMNIHMPLEQALASVGADSTAAVLQRKFDPSLPYIAGDHDRLVQVFINLLRNAVEAGAGNITVSTSYSSQPPLDAARQKKLPVTVRIEDDGAGMNAETQSRLFEPYYTTKPSGQGLGLAVVAKIIGDHGGRIAVESTAGRTVFTLSFGRHA